MSALLALRIPDQRHKVPRRSGTRERLSAVSCPAPKRITPPAAEPPLGPGSALRFAQLVRDTKGARLRLRWARTRGARA